MFVSENGKNMYRSTQNKKKKFAYKYSINDQLNLLPRTMKMQEVIAHLESFGISRNEFYADRNISLASSRSIPSDRLIIYSKVFDCKIEQLINKQITATSIRHLNASKNLKG